MLFVVDQCITKRVCSPLHGEAFHTAMQKNCDKYDIVSSITMLKNEEDRMVVR